MKLRDLTGKKFGSLTALETCGRMHGHVAWRCVCDCGNEKVVSMNHLVKGAVRSCGCLSDGKYKKIAVAGVKKTYTQWSAETGIPAATIRQRMRLGWTAERATTLENGAGKATQWDARVDYRVKSEPMETCKSPLKQEGCERYRMRDPMSKLCVFFTAGAGAAGTCCYKLRAWDNSYCGWKPRERRKDAAKCRKR